MEQLHRDVTKRPRKGVSGECKRKKVAVICDFETRRRSMSRDEPRVFLSLYSRSSRLWEAIRDRTVGLVIAAVVAKSADWPGIYLSKIVFG